MAEELPITVYQGDTYRREFTVYTDDTLATTVDITSWTFLAQIRAGVADAAITVEAAFQSTIINGPGGVFELVLPPASSAGLDPSVVHWWDVEATLGNGDVVTLMRGQVTVIAEVSR